MGRVNYSSILSHHTKICASNLASVFIFNLKLGILKKIIMLLKLLYIYQIIIEPLIITTAQTLII